MGDTDRPWLKQYAEVLNSIFNNVYAVCLATLSFPDIIIIFIIIVVCVAER